MQNYNGYFIGIDIFAAQKNETKGRASYKAIQKPKGCK